MKNAVILHGVEGNSNLHWYSWLKDELRSRGYKVWVPNLPNFDEPDVNRVVPFLIDNWDFDDETLLIGHSAGATTALHLLQVQNDKVKIDKLFLVAPLKDDLGRTELSKLFTDDPFNWEGIKSTVKNIYVIHDKDDSIVPHDHGEYIANKLDAKIISTSGNGHYITEDGDQNTKLPVVLELLRQK